MHEEHPKIPTILILIGGHFASSPRALKEAQELAKVGARVLVRGLWWNSQLASEDLDLAKALSADFKPMVDLRLGAPGRQAFRIQQRLAKILFTFTGIVHSRLFGPAREMVGEAMLNAPDLVLVHSEAGLWAGRHLLGKRMKVAVDFEDWFSQDLLPEDRKTRPVRNLQSLERYLLCNAQLCFSPTHTMGRALAEDAQCQMQPLRVPNCFPPNSIFQGDPLDARVPSGVKFYWVSQTIGRGRGLETLGQALTCLKGEWQMVLRGTLREDPNWLNEVFPRSVLERIVIEGPVPNSEMAAATMVHDVGLALEEPYCANKDLTASNKIFEYLRAGLAVVATSTKGQSEVMDACPGAGLVVPPGNVEALGSALQRMMDSPAFLQSCKEHSRTAGRTVWNWETHAQSLLAAIDCVLTCKASC